MLKLLSQEGDVFEVENDVGIMSKLIKCMVEDSGPDEEIPLPNVKSAILIKVIEYCNHHKNSPVAEIEKPLKTIDMRQLVSEWDAEFMMIEHDMLFELIKAANYLDIKSLLDLSCAKIASMLKGKTPEQIRNTFGN